MYYIRQFFLLPSDMDQQKDETRISPALSENRR